MQLSTFLRGVLIRIRALNNFLITKLIGYLPSRPNCWITSKKGFAFSGFFKSFFLIPICLIRFLISLGSNSRLNVWFMWLNQGVSFYITDVGLDMN